MRERQAVPRLDQFLLAPGGGNLCAQQVRVDGNAILHPRSAANLDRLRRLQRGFRHLSLPLSVQHPEVSLQCLVNNLLTCAVRLLLGRLLHVFGATYAVPALQPVKCIPLSREAAGEITDRRRRVEAIECKVGESKVLLPQPCPKDKYRIISADG